MTVTMPIPDKRQILETAARFFEHDLHDMRRRAIQQFEHQRDTSRKPCPQGCTPGSAVDPESEGVPSPCRTCKGTAFIEDWDGREFPIGSSHEGDLMKAVEWATAAATLRAMAREETP